MLRILFVCRANLCRSPMAEALMRHKIEQAGLQDQIQVDSAGTHVPGDGMSPVPEVLQLFAGDHPVRSIRSRQLDYADFQTYDHIFAMDHANLAFIQRHNRGTSATVNLLLMATGLYQKVGFTEVSDPYPDGDFAATFALISYACDDLLRLFSQQLSTSESPLTTRD